MNVTQPSPFEAAEGPAMDRLAIAAPCWASVDIEADEAYRAGGSGRPPAPSVSAIDSSVT